MKGGGQPYVQAGQTEGSMLDFMTRVAVDTLWMYLFVRQVRGHMQRKCECKYYAWEYVLLITVRPAADLSLGMFTAYHGQISS